MDDYYLVMQPLQANFMFPLGIGLIILKSIVLTELVYIVLKLDKYILTGGGVI